MAQAPRGFRNNNPGNIEFGPFARQAGAVGSDGRFAVFPDMNAGKHAMVRLLRSYAGRGIDTPEEIINRWAPPSDGNDSTAYVNSVVSRAGLDAKQPLNFNDPAQIEKFVAAMIMHENGALPTGSTPIGTMTEGGAVAAAPPPAAGMDRLKAALGGGYDTEALSQADRFLAGGAETAKGAKNWMDVLNSGLQTGLGTYEKHFGEGAKKKEYAEGQRTSLANAADPMAAARVLMASPDANERLAGIDLFAKASAAAAKGSDESFSKAPIWGEDAQGNPALVQVSDRGKSVQTALPPGVQIRKDPIKVDAGTHFILLDPVTRQPISQIPKDVAGEAAQRKVGEGAGAGQVNLPGVEGAAARIYRQLSGVEQDPNLPNVTGWQAYLPTLSGAAHDTEQRIAQLGGSAFLQAFQELKGGGVITDIEGTKATQALARLTEMKQSDAGFRQALADFRTEVEALVELARRKANSPTSVQTQTIDPRTGQPMAAPGGGGKRLRYNPETGELE